MKAAAPYISPRRAASRELLPEPTEPTTISSLPCCSSNLTLVRIAGAPAGHQEAMHGIHTPQQHLERSAHGMTPMLGLGVSECRGSSISSCCSSYVVSGVGCGQLQPPQQLLMGRLATYLMCTAGAHLAPNPAPPAWQPRQVSQEMREAARQAAPSQAGPETSAGGPKTRGTARWQRHRWGCSAGGVPAAPAGQRLGRPAGG